MEILTEKEEEDALDVIYWHLDALNPVENFQTLLDPSWRGVAVGLTIPAYITAAAYIVGSPLFSTGATWAPNFRGLAATRIWVSQEMRKAMFRGAVTGFKVGGAPLLAATASAGASYVYEKEVNEPIRKSSGGSGSNTWFGPFASGFGSVV